MEAPTLVRPVFPLTTRSWIPVRFVSGESRELSILEAFRRAEEIREISCELPTQTFAILRLLLAILYRVPEQFDEIEWTQWHAEGLPLDAIEAYLTKYESRFDLFDTERPFFQVADLHTRTGEQKDAASLIFDLPSNNRLFTTRSGTEATSLSYAEAARWLVNAQAFDASGIKSGAIGDDRVTGGKGYPIGVGWSGLLGGVYANGQTLHDTLLLNLVPPGSWFDFDAESDLPPWEDAEPDTAAARVTLVPRGPARLYTWQSRRIRLFRSGGRVSGCLIANGDKLTPQNMFTVEPMSSWRFSEPQTKALTQTTYMPREHLQGRALWRGISALLPGISPIVTKRGVPATLTPGLIEWLAHLRDNEIVARPAHLRLRSVGVVYGSNNSVVDDVLSDEVDFSLTLLREKSRPLARQAEHAVELAEAGARSVRQLAENLDRAAGGDGIARGEKARQATYAALDEPYRRWLRGLDGDEAPLVALDGWKDLARTTLLRVGADLIADAPPAAWTGREVTHLGRTELITTARAENWFRRSIAKSFTTTLENTTPENTTPEKDADDERTD
ncbi:type I-E CRISPR-associated protein Cse1/CasA [Microbacterium hominis]|uniref:Type I-E CRISPR-associated protein Cse1/CasA n=1 Tax=Microbacterium hominis TaxID=162426 RepID=A0A2K9DDC8_9MICO|nr:type I-E CRISPR-associated protein Cse1/CasA [Microbacterium hominis]AUG30932.1 type I-E CRISPR-associated protein Cse1/CasA [Microbacterium hominis]